MQIMTEKKMLVRDTGQRSNIYSPKMDPGDVQTNILNHVIKTAFRGNTTKLVLSALGNKRTTVSEMDKDSEIEVDMDADVNVESDGS